MIRNPLASHPAHEDAHPGGVAHLPRGVPEIELGEVAGQVFHTDVVVRAIRALPQTDVAHNLNRTLRQ